MRCLSSILSQVRILTTTDVEEFKKKDISAFFKQTALVPKDFHQPSDIYEPSQSDAQLTTLQAYGYSHVSFSVLEARVLLISPGRYVQRSGRIKTRQIHRRSWIWQIGSSIVCLREHGPQTPLLRIALRVCLNSSRLLNLATYHLPLKHH